MSDPAAAPRWLRQGPTRELHGGSGRRITDHYAKRRAGPAGRPCHGSDSSGGRSLSQWTSTALLLGAAGRLAYLPAARAELLRLFSEMCSVLPAGAVHVLYRQLLRGSVAGGEPSAVPAEPFVRLPAATHQRFGRHAQLSSLAGQFRHPFLARSE